MCLIKAALPNMTPNRHYLMNIDFSLEKVDNKIQLDSRWRRKIMTHIISIIIGILLIIGGYFTFRHTRAYLKENTAKGKTSHNQWWGFALWGGYIGAGALILVGIIVICVSFFK